MSSNKLHDSILSIGQKSSSKNSMMNSNLSLIPDSPKLVAGTKEKSKTLPQNLTVPSPIRGSNSSTSIFRTPRITVTPDSPNKSPGKMSGLNFIRRSRSTKLSRSNSLLRSVTSRYIEEGVDREAAVVSELPVRYEEFAAGAGGREAVLGALVRRHEALLARSPLALRRAYLDVDDDVAVHSGEIRQRCEISCSIAMYSELCFIIWLIAH